MARRRREYEDDDGRTIADMSDVSRPSLMGRRAPERPEDSLSRESCGGGDDYIPPEDRKWYVLGALKAVGRKNYSVQKEQTGGVVTRGRAAKLISDVLWK